MLPGHRLPLPLLGSVQIHVRGGATLVPYGSCGVDRPWPLFRDVLGSLFYLGSRIDALAARMEAGFDRVDARFDRVDARFDRADARMDAFSDKLSDHIERSAG